MKKLKIFAIVGLIGLITTSVLMFWGGVYAVRFANDQLKNVSLQSLPAITTLSCWNKAQSLLNPEPWITKPVADNLNSLKTACLDVKPKTQINTESEQI